MGLVKVLTSMGYRRMSSNMYGKPVGFHLFTYELDTNEFTNWFKSGDKMCRWNTNIYQENKTAENDFLIFLQYTEAFTKTDHLYQSNFEFLTGEEYYNLMLGALAQPG